MIITPPAVSGPSLGPFPFVIFAAEFATDGRIGHIDHPKQKPAQMGEMGDSASRSRHGGVKFDETKNDDEVFSRDRKKKVDIDESIGKQPAKGQEDAIDGSRSPNDGDELMRGEDDGADSCPDAAEEEILEEFS